MNDLGYPFLEIGHASIQALEESTNLCVSILTLIQRSENLCNLHGSDDGFILLNSLNRVTQFLTCFLKNIGIGKIVWHESHILNVERNILVPARNNVNGRFSDGVPNGEFIEYVWIAVGQICDN